MDTINEPAWKAARRRSIIDTGFKMFSERGIDLVSIDEIAKACGMTRVTIYRYFPSKLDLVIEIGSVMWREYYSKMSEKYPSGITDALSAREHFELFLDCFIDLYREKRALLRFNQYFNLYIGSMHATGDQLRPYTAAIFIIKRSFLKLYRKAQRDGTLRTDISEERMFSALLHIMLAAVTRYAAGLVYVPDSGAEPVEELIMLKEMLINKFAVQSEVL